GQAGLFGVGPLSEPGVLWPRSEAPASPRSNRVASLQKGLSAATWQVCRSVILSASAIHAPDPPRPVFLPGHRRTNPQHGCSNGFGVRYLLYRHMENRFGGGRGPGGTIYRINRTQPRCERW